LRKESRLLELISLLSLVPHKIVEPSALYAKDADKSIKSPVPDSINSGGLSMIVRSKLSLSWLVIALLLFSSALVFAKPPLQSRTVNRLSRPNEPVQISAVKVKGKAVGFGKAFAGRNNWLGGLTFVIKNTPAKTISWARVALRFQEAKASEGGLTDVMTYGIGRWDEDKIRGGGPPLKPGDTAEVSYSLEQYQSVRDILDGMGYPRSIAQIEVSVDQVIFAVQPELMWIEGTRSEFHSPTGWRPVKP